MIDFIYYLTVVFVSWSVFCRACRMDSTTPRRLRIQNGAVMLLTLASLPIFGLNATPALLGLALGVYLLFDAVKWPPGGSCDPQGIRAVYGRDDK